MKKNNLNNKDNNIIHIDEDIYRHYYEVVSSFAIAVTKNGLIEKKYDCITDCNKDFPDITLGMIPCMYMGYRFVWLDDIKK